ncbi:MAG: stage II sporulation protein R [Oscillospiraceae bacterium]|nr:stage II sporulation protein R [Oscillospiraceae bacterium]
MKKVCICFISITAVWLLFAGVLLEQESLSAELIRIHVLANSDSAEDQAVKLEVRDAVLSRVTALTKTCGTREEAAQALAGNAEELADVASAVAGKDVTVSLSPEWYETRKYETFSLPAGKYLSLRVQIGEAGGHNWWCVAFPAVCTAATTEEFETVAVSGGLSDSDIRLMTEDDPDVTVRFFLLELFSKLRAALQG